MRARCQRSLFSDASRRRTSRELFHELSCLMTPGSRSRVIRSNAWAARLTTPGSLSQRHSIKSEKAFSCASTRAATSSARPTEMRACPSWSMARMDAGLAIFFAALILSAMGRDEHFCGDAANTAQHLLDGPAAFSIGEEDFAAAADFRAVIPALEQGQVGLANGC